MTRLFPPSLPVFRTALSPSSLLWPYRLIAFVASAYAPAPCGFVFLDFKSSASSTRGWVGSIPMHSRQIQPGEEFQGFHGGSFVFVCGCSTRTHENEKALKRPHSAILGAIPEYVRCAGGGKAAPQPESVSSPCADHPTAHCPPRPGVDFSDPAL